MKAKKHFFSFIELLMVVAILIILMSLLQPSLKSILENSKQLHCNNNLKEIGISSALYSQDSNHKIVPGMVHRSITGDHYAYPWWADAFYSDPVLLGQYGGNPGPWNGSNIWGRVNDNDSIFICPSDTRKHKEAKVYGVNYGVNMISNGVFGTTKSQFETQLTIHQLSSPNRTVFLIDSYISRFHPGYGSQPNAYGVYDEMTGLDWKFGSPTSHYNWSRRHLDGANVLYQDSSVRFSEDLQQEVQHQGVVFK